MGKPTTSACRGCGQEIANRPGVGRARVWCNECRSSRTRRPAPRSSCAVCEQPVPLGRRFYCGDECQQLAHAAQKRERYQPGRYNRPKSMECRPCGWCGDLFDYHPKLRIRYCSRACGHAARSEGAVCVVPWRQCSRCGEMFVSRRGRRSCNQNECLSVGVRDKPMTVACEHCGLFFSYVWRTQQRRYCSVKCIKAASQARDPETFRSRRSDAKQRRAAKKRGAYVEDVWRAKVYERDSWRCQLCGKRVKRDAVVPHPLAPTLDHIVPLADGGTHEYANVQTAHFICNSRKGDRGTDQLRLIG